MNALLGRGSETGVAAGAVVPSLGFAPDAMAVAPFEDALAFATKAPKVPTTAAMAGGWRAWIRGSLGRANFDGTDANFGFKYRTVSGELGLERVAGPWLYGAAFGFGNAKVDQDVTRDHGSLDTWRVGAYAAYRPGPWWVTAAVAVGFHDIGATRLSAFPVPATSSYDARTLSAGIEAVRRFALAHATVEPLAGLVYTALRVDSFTESGTTFLDLAGSGTSIDALKGYVGARVYRSFAWAHGFDVTPELRGRLLYDFLNDRRAYTARFIADPTATPIAVTGLQPDRFATMIGAAVTTRFSPTWRSFASYDAEIRGGDVAHLLSGGIKG